jgi:hypothetical protein
MQSSSRNVVAIAAGKFCRYLRKGEREGKSYKQIGRAMREGRHKEHRKTMARKR